MASANKGRAMTDASPAEWYPDPMGRHEYRWYDGQQWTDQVSSHGRQTTDSLDVDAKQVVGTVTPEKIQGQVNKHDAQVAKAGNDPRPPMDAPATNGLFDQMVVVINQKVKLIEVNTEFAIYNTAGVQIGAVRQVGQSALKKLFRFVGSWDQYFTHKFQVVDHQGVVIMTLTRPAKFLKSSVIVGDAVGTEVGRLVQQNVFGKIRFGLESNGQTVGMLKAENWRAWNFTIADANDAAVARITKTFEGILKTTFTAADNYVLEINTPLSDPLRTLTFAAALAVDIALKQDKRGLSPLDALDF